VLPSCFTVAHRPRARPRLWFAFATGPMARSRAQVSGRLAEAPFPEHGQQRTGGVEDGLNVRRIHLPPRFQQEGRSLSQPHPP